MTLTKKQRLEAYTYAYLCVLSGFDENGKEVFGYTSQYVCDYLQVWGEEEFKKHIRSNEILFPEWYALKPEFIPVGARFGWWLQNSPERAEAVERAIIACENSKR